MSLVESKYGASVKDMTWSLCENRVTECYTVVMGTAFAMDVPPVSYNNFSYL